jgi:hypothetical protein
MLGDLSEALEVQYRRCWIRCPLASAAFYGWPDNAEATVLADQLETSSHREYNPRKPTNLEPLTLGAPDSRVHSTPNRRLAAIER